MKFLVRFVTALCRLFFVTIAVESNFRSTVSCTNPVCMPLKLKTKPVPPVKAAWSVRIWEPSASYAPLRAALLCELGIQQPASLRKHYKD